MCPVQAVLLPCFEYNVQLYSCTAGYLIYMYLSRPLARTVGSSTAVQLLESYIESWVTFPCLRPYSRERTVSRPNCEVKSVQNQN